MYSFIIDHLLTCRSEETDGSERRKTNQLMVRHTHTRTHRHFICAVVWAVAERVCVGVVLCVLQCVCITPGLWVFREIVEFLSQCRIRKHKTRSCPGSLCIENYVARSAFPLIRWRPHHNLVKCGRRDSAVTLVSMSQLFTLQTFEVFPQAQLANLE